MDYQWFQEMDCAVTVCNEKADIIYMNNKAIATFVKDGQSLIGKNLKECHSKKSWDIIQKLLSDGGTNSYTIEKKGIKKLIYQTPWYKDGHIAGLVEISMIIPNEMPHYIRS